MSENTNPENVTPHEGATAAAPALEAVEAQPAEPQHVETQAEAHHEEVSYHAVEKSGKITAIWEMKGRKHVRTIDPRSAEGRHLLGHTDNPEVVQSATV